jgi:hypothetical protein
MRISASLISSLHPLAATLHLVRYGRNVLLEIPVDLMRVQSLAYPLGAQLLQVLHEVCLSSGRFSDPNQMIGYFLDEIRASIRGERLYRRHG